MIERRLPEAFIIRAIDGTSEARLVPYSDDLLEQSDKKPRDFIPCYDFSLDSCVMRQTEIFYCGWRMGLNGCDYRHFRVIDYVRYSDTDFEVFLDEITWDAAKALRPSYRIVPVV